MSKQLPTKPISFWARLLSPITKAFSKTVEKPERPAHGASSVSYTHLTLPTIYSV